MQVAILDLTSFKKCTPLKLSNGGSEYETINNMCDTNCKWTMKSTTAPTTAPTGMPSTSTEGFTPMLRPHIRNARHLITNGTDKIKSSVNRIKRQLF